MVRYSELTWNYNQELDMFPKGQQKKKDTIVVIVDGKTPQTIPTMDTPPEPQKLPKCRLFVILTVILILSLVLLAGYCAWLFFSYETDALSPSIGKESDALLNNPTIIPKLEDALHISTSLPKHDETGSDIFSVEEEGSSDFLFISGSDSSLESVYDSSEPYGNSEVSFSSSLSWPADYELSYSDSSSLTIADNTKKSDRYLSTNDNKGKPRFNRLKFLFDKFRNGDDTMVEENLSYDVMSSYWFQRAEEEEEEEVNDPSYGEIAFDSEFDKWDWMPSSDPEEGSGFDIEYDNSMDSDWPIDLFSEISSDVMSSEGSGDMMWYDSYEDDYIPRPVDSPRVRIDQSPPERLEISVCNWPKKLFEKQAHNYGSVKMAQYQNPNYDVTSLSTSNVFITQIRSEINNVLTVRIFMRDYSVALVAVREMIKTPTSTISSCYFSFLTPELQEDAFGNDHGRDDEDEFEGSGTDFGNDLQELTLQIRYPILLGSELPIFSNPIDKICAHSTKYWAKSFHIKN